MICVCGVQAQSLARTVDGLFLATHVCLSEIAKQVGVSNIFKFLFVKQFSKRRLNRFYSHSSHIYIYNFKEKLKRKECEFCETSLICCLFVCWFVYLFVCLVVRLRSPFSVFVSIFLFISFSIGFMLSLHLSIMRGHDRTIFQPKKIFLLIKSQMHINLFVRFCIHYYIHTNIHIIC